MDGKIKRYYTIGNITYSFAIIVHFSWMFMFYLIKAPILSLINIGSTLIFIFAIFVNRKGYYLIAAAIAILEIVLHQILCVKFIGWDSGFQYYLIGLPILPFLLGHDKKFYRVILSSLCLFAYLYAAIYLKNIQPIYSIKSIASTTLNYFNMTSTFSLIIFLTFYFNNAVQKAEEALEVQFQRAENLLLNILPKPIANRLKENTNIIADGFSESSVFFLDLVGFTTYSSEKSPDQIVNVLNKIFSLIDDLAVKHGVEKIKTIGDAYMAATGIPLTCKNHAEIISNFAIDVRHEFLRLNKELNHNLNFRIGINSGPIVAGVIGKNKYVYDLWGDTVNIASRMESHGIPGSIHISEKTYEYIKDKFIFEDRGDLDIKGKGIMKTYLLIDSK